MKITKKQVLELNNNAFHGESGLIADKLKQWFSKAFKTELEVGKWYKGDDNEIVCYQGNNSGFGFIERGDWYFNKGWEFENKHKKWELATTQEVEAALIAEAEKRGFKEGNYLDLSDLGFSNNDLICSDNMYWDGTFLNLGRFKTGIFANGVWGKAFQAMTKREAEEKLNCKIV